MEIFTQNHCLFTVDWSCSTSCWYHVWITTKDSSQKHLKWYPYWFWLVPYRSSDMSTLFTRPTLIPWPHTGTYNSPPCDGFKTSCQLNTSSDECVRTKLVRVRLTLWACAFVVLTLWYFPALYCRMRDGVTSQATGEPFHYKQESYLVLFSK